MLALSWPANLLGLVPTATYSQPYRSADSSQFMAPTHRVLCPGKGVVAQSIHDQRDRIAIANDRLSTASQGGTHRIVTLVRVVRKKKAVSTVNVVYCRLQRYSMIYAT